MSHPVPLDTTLGRAARVRRPDPPPPRTPQAQRPERARTTSTSSPSARSPIIFAGPTRRLRSQNTSHSRTPSGARKVAILLFPCAAGNSMPVSSPMSIERHQRVGIGLRLRQAEHEHAAIRDGQDELLGQTEVGRRGCRQRAAHPERAGKCCDGRRQHLLVRRENARRDGVEPRDRIAHYTNLPSDSSRTAGRAIRPW